MTIASTTSKNRLGGLNSEKRRNSIRTRSSAVMPFPRYQRCLCNALQRLGNGIHLETQPAPKPFKATNLRKHIGWGHRRKAGAAVGPTESTLSHLQTVLDGPKFTRSSGTIDHVERGTSASRSDNIHRLFLCDHHIVANPEGVKVCLHGLSVSSAEKRVNEGRSE